MRQLLCHFLCSIALLVTCAQASGAGNEQWLTYPGGDGPGKGKHIVLIAADQEYRSEQSMPMMAKILSAHHGFDCTVLFGVNEKGEVDGQPLMGRSHDDPPNSKLEPLPVAWIKNWDTGTGKVARVFHSTMGSGTDLQNAGLRRLIINAAHWCMELDPALAATRSVDIVGEYKPLKSGFNYPEPGVKPQPVSACK